MSTTRRVRPLGGGGRRRCEKRRGRGGRRGGGLTGGGAAMEVDGRQRQGSRSWYPGELEDGMRDERCATDAL
jgi:hypothetical protein